MYSTILSQRISLLSAPTLNPVNCSGDWRDAAAVRPEDDTSAEASKNGFAPAEVAGLASFLNSLRFVHLHGLMTMAALDGSADDARRVFARAREIFEEMKWHKIGGTALKHLSMGMSNDFEAAIEEGATLVRVGTLLFGGKVADEEMSHEE